MTGQRDPRPFGFAVCSKCTEHCGRKIPNFWQHWVKDEPRVMILGNKLLYHPTANASLGEKIGPILSARNIMQICSSYKSDGVEAQKVDHGLLYTIVPGQIKEAAGKRFAWEAFNGTVYGLSWPASTDFTTEEETKEEMMYYGKAAEGLKLEDDVCRQESSAIDFDEAEEMDCEYKYESEGYDTEVDDEEYDVMSIGEEFQSAWGGSADECVKRAVSPLSASNLSYFDDAQIECRARLSSRSHGCNYILLSILGDTSSYPYLV